MPVRYFKYDQPFATRRTGEKLPELTIAYHTFGTFKGNNAVWVCHALTANSDVADWWPSYRSNSGPVSRPEALFHRLREHHRLALRIDRPVETSIPRPGSRSPAHSPSSRYATWSTPIFCWPTTSASHRLTPVVGSSIGGFQALEMALTRPNFARKLVLIATAARSQPWAIAFNESQRMAIETGRQSRTGRP